MFTFIYKERFISFQTVLHASDRLTDRTGSSNRKGQTSLVDVFWQLGHMLPLNLSNKNITHADWQAVHVAFIHRGEESRGK